MNTFILDSFITSMVKNYFMAPTDSRLASHFLVIESFCSSNGKWDYGQADKYEDKVKAVKFFIRREEIYSYRSWYSVFSYW